MSETTHQAREASEPPGGNTARNPDVTPPVSAAVTTPAVTAAEVPARAAGRRKRPGDQETKFPRGLVIRLFAYLVAGHLFAGFLYLLFTVGSHN